MLHMQSALFLILELLQEFSHQEKRHWTMPTDESAMQITLSPDGRSLAYVHYDTTTQKFRVFQDGKSGAAFDRVTFLAYSQDGSRFGFAAEAGGDHFFLTGGEQFGPFDSLYKEDLQSAGSKLMLRAKRGPVQYLLINGVLYDADAVLGARVSPDGSRWAACLRKDKKNQWIVDGVSEERPWVCKEIVFSRDSKRLACLAEPRSWIVDDAAVESEGIAGPLAFSPDGSRHGFVQVSNGKHCVVTNGVRGKEFQGDKNPAGRAPVFSADGKRVAWFLKVEDHLSVVIDDIPGPTYSSVEYVQFSPDGKRFAYVRENSNVRTVVEDGKEGDPYSWILGLKFDPSSRTLAYLARSDKKSRWYYFENQQLRMEAESVDLSLDIPLFNRDGSRVALVAFLEGKQQVLINGKSGESCGAISHFQFTPDGKKLIVVAKVEDGEAIFVDGRKLAGYSRIPMLRCSKDGRRLGYWALKGREFWWKTSELR